MRIVRVNMGEGTVELSAVPEKYRLLGGRALTSQLVADEVPATCEPLGPRNKLVIAPGLLGGSYLSSSSRLSVGAKSPLTGGIKESNAGGTAALYLSRLGIKAIIIEGASPGGNYSRYLYLNKDGGELRPAEFALKGTFASANLLFDRYGKKVSLILIGPAGERSFLSAGIAITDPEGRPSRYSGRGGLGAVMGSKGLKAIVLDLKDISGIGYSDRQAFRDLAKELNGALLENPITGEVYKKYGTAGIAARTNALHALPTCNFSRGSFEHTSKLHGEYMYNVIQARGGEGHYAHICMPGCLIQCSNIYADAAGKEIVSPLEYETIGLLGSNLGIGNLDDIARLNYICNDLGLDTIEIGAALGVAMEQGIAPFGDAAAAEKLLGEIASNTILGRVLAQGTAVTGCVLGSRRIPVVKGQGMPAYDPRAVKGMGVTYLTSPMGADHTAGPTIRAQVEHTDPKPQPEISRNAQRNIMVADSLGLCMFSMAVYGSNFEKLAKLIEYRYGDSCDEQQLRQMARRALKEELDFNRRAGFSPADDRMPEYMTSEPMPGLDSVFDVPAEELDRLHEDL